MLLWFRNDLRVHDNPALDHVLNNKAAKNYDNFPQKAIFFISEKQWQAHDVSAIKIDFIKRHVTLLTKQLARLQIELLVIHAENFDEQVTFLHKYCKDNNLTEIVANREVELNECKRDERFQTSDITLRLFEADVIVPKGKVLNQAGEMYKVFTPFKKAWLSHVRTVGFSYIQKYPQCQLTVANGDEENVPSLSSQWPLINVIEQDVIPHFLQHKFVDYAKYRDFPAIKGTSGLSPYFAIGALSPRYILTLITNKYPDILLDSKHALFTWVNELIWREFYRHLLFHQPRLCKHACFNEKYQYTQWHNSMNFFTCWREGKTGYPLVDAAMRQLNQTGWMHNRLRMVVASFLTKHLLVDWRWGEKYFMQQLIDGDLATNNGGWQWAASTGCDAQPYFRIFNPIKQSERYDPDGTFIRKYLPELNDIPNKHIHFPHEYIKKHKLDCYWPAIVEHKAARQQALDFYKP